MYISYIANSIYIYIYLRSLLTFYFDAFIHGMQGGIFKRKYEMNSGKNILY